MEIHLDGARLSYEARGQGRLLVALHGLALDHRQALYSLEPAFEHRGGWQRLYFDLPGMGQSRADIELASSDHIVDLLCTALDQIAPGRSFAIAGYSYGAYLARAIARRFPGRVDGLCLVCPVILADRTRRTVPEHRPLQVDREFLASLPNDQRIDFESYAVIQNEHTWRETKDNIKIAEELNDQEFLAALDLNYSVSSDIDGGGYVFAGPSLFLLGRHDACVGYVDAYALLDVYPGAHFVLLDRAGHNIGVEQRELVTTLTDDWVTRLETET